MICIASFLILLLASAALAQMNVQTLMPGTLASSIATEPAATFVTASSSSSATRPAITGQQRIQWAVRGAIGPASLTSGLFSAGWGTLFNVPRVYGTHWQGFGESYGMRLTSRAVSNTMEAGLGAIWGEDPRYPRDVGAPFGNRIGHAVKMTFLAEKRDGGLMPAYARFAAFPGANFLSTTWRTDSDATLSHAAIRTGFKFLGRLGSNTFQEFRPDVQQKLFPRRRMVEMSRVP